MAGCPAALSGRHVWREGPRGRTERYICSCGARARTEDVHGDAEAYYERQQRRATHITINCPCHGDIDRCDYWCALHLITKQDRRIGYAEDAYQRARWVYEDALRDLRKAEQKLHAEQAERDRLTSFVESQRAG